MQLTAFTPFVSCTKGLTHKLQRGMKLIAILLTIVTLQVAAKGDAQTVTLDLKNVPVQRVFKDVSRQTGLSVVYPENMFTGMQPVSIRVRNATVEEVMEKCLNGQPLVYALNGRTIVISPKPGMHTGSDKGQSALSPPDPISGIVLDEKGNPLPSVSVTNTRTKKTITTDEGGRFSIDAAVNDVLEFSYVG